MKYEVSKEKGGQYYAHPQGEPTNAVKGSFGDKKKAIKVAARLCGISAKEYTKLKAKEGVNERDS